MGEALLNAIAYAFLVVALAHLGRMRKTQTAMNAFIIRTSSRICKSKYYNRRRQFKCAGRGLLAHLEKG